MNSGFLKIDIPLLNFMAFDTDSLLNLWIFNVSLNSFFYFYPEKILLLKDQLKNFRLKKKKVFVVKNEKTIFILSISQVEFLNKWLTLLFYIQADLRKYIFNNNNSSIVSTQYEMMKYTRRFI